MKKPIPPKTKVLKITKAEALFLDDAFTMLTFPEEKISISGVRPVTPSAMGVAPPDLIARIGMAVLLTPADDGITEAELVVDEGELYLLREVANTNIKFLDEMVGYSLKRKIYMALLEDSYKQSLQFAKLMKDLEQDSTTSRNKAKIKYSPQS